jgi:catechol 2,3-dioxygenase-like lactoylglutathione lyase family enzyme
MGLNDGTVGTAIAVTDMGRAIDFYEGKLGLTGGVVGEDGGRTYFCAGSTRLHVFPSPHAAATGATVATFTVSDVDATVDELGGRGVVFEQYTEPFPTDARGIGTFGEHKGAWLKDPDGNVISISDY